MAIAMLPHGPLELAAYSMALALYLRARRGPLPVRHVLATAGVCLIGLLTAAVLETYVAL
jgi:hypothetical protein